MLKVGQPMIISAPIYLAEVLDVIFILIICLIGKKIVGHHFEKGPPKDHPSQI